MGPYRKFRLRDVSFAHCKVKRREMKFRLLAAVWTAGLLAALPVVAQAQGTVFIVRHAEKLDESVDPPLSDAGRARASALSRVLKDAGVTAIYTSEYQRTMQTAEPLAQALKLQPVTVPASDLDTLVARLRIHQHRNEIVLVVGHSDTIPRVIRALGHPKLIAIVGYDDLFITVPQGEAPPRLLRLRF